MKLFPWVANAMALGALVVTAVTACSNNDDSAALAALSDACTINSDCTSPLVCAFQSCHDECAATVDCPNGERCVVSDRPFHVCQLPSEKLCMYNSECPTGQVCATDGQCRDQCASSKDCVIQQTCIAAVCVDNTEIADGSVLLAATTDASTGGTTCIHSSDCPGALVCLRGICAAECLTSKDCLSSWTCIDSRCVMPGVDVSTDVDGSTADAGK